MIPGTTKWKSDIRVCQNLISLHSDAKKTIPRTGDTATPTSARSAPLPAVDAATPRQQGTPGPSGYSPPLPSGGTPGPSGSSPPLAYGSSPPLPEVVRPPSTLRHNVRSPPVQRVFTPSQSEVQIHDSVGGMLRDLRPSSVVSAPSRTGMNASSQKLSANVSSTLRSATLQTSPMYRFADTPAWSLRYATLMGTMGDGDEGGSTKRNWHRKAISKKGEEIREYVPESFDSVYLAKGKDKRGQLLQRRDDPNSRDEYKISRFVGRRHALWSSRHKMQVTVAVANMQQKNPDHMRKLNRAVETMTGKGKIVVNVKHLDEKHLGQVVGTTGLQEEEIESLFSSFTRYDIDDSGYLDRDEVHQVLCDLGLQPRGREEKVEVHEALVDADREGLRYYSFDDFVCMVKSIRERLRILQYGECLIAFEEADRNDSKSLSMEEILSMFDQRFHAMPRNNEERQEFMLIFRSCDGNDDGELEFSEFMDFVGRAKAKLVMMRREEELTIAKAFHLAPEITNEFRMDLPVLWSLFNRYDHDGQSSVSQLDIVGLLMDVGVCPKLPQVGDEKLSIALNAVKQRVLCNIDFPVLLRLVCEIRNKAKVHAREHLLERFNFYDKHKRGELSFAEVYQILADFKMLPKTRDEQASIVSVIERMDDDGSGSFNFNEFQEFFQRLTEQVQFQQREAERQAILNMGFNEIHLQYLRNSFLSLNPLPNGKILQIGLITSIHVVREKLCMSDLDEVAVREVTRIAQQAPDHRINFQEFAQLLKPVLMKNVEGEPLTMMPE